MRRLKSNIDPKQFEQLDPEHKKIFFDKFLNLRHLFESNDPSDHQEMDKKIGLYQNVLKRLLNK